MRYAVYARVSSEIQKDRHTIGSQLVAGRSYVSERDGVLVGDGDFIDDGRTAKTGHLEKRDGLARLHAACARREIDIVVVVDLDRFTRSELLRERAYVYGPLQEAGVRIAVCSTGQVLDLHTDEGDLQLSIGNMQSSSWLKKHCDRIKRGKLMAISNGKKPAGPTPLGWLYDRVTGQWSIDHELAAVVIEIKERVAAGETCSSISRDLIVRGVRAAQPSRTGRRKAGSWTPERVWQIATRRSYLGEWVADKAKGLKVKVPRIVSDELQEAVDRALRRYGVRGLNRTRHEYVAHGLAKCGICHADLGCVSTYSGSRARRRIFYYTCIRRRRPLYGDKPCALPMRQAGEVDDRVWCRLVKWLMRPGAVERALKKRAARATSSAHDWTLDLRGYERKLAQLERDEFTLMERFRRRMISQGAMDAALTQMSRERAMLELQVDTAKRQAASQEVQRAETRSLEESIDDLRHRAESATLAERRAIVRSLVAEILVHADKIEVRLELRTDQLFAHLELAANNSSEMYKQGKRLSIRLVA